MASEKLVSLSITDKVYSDFYSPVMKAVYVSAKLTCTREVAVCKSSGVWIFVSDSSKVSNTLAKSLQAKYNEMVTVRRSSYPPMKMES